MADGNRVHGGQLLEPNECPQSRDPPLRTEPLRVAPRESIAVRGLDAALEENRFVRVVSSRAYVDPLPYALMDPMRNGGRHALEEF